MWKLVTFSCVAAASTCDTLAASMTLIRAFISSLLACAVLSLASCIDGREEVWLNADGSGRADLFYDVPASAARFHGGVKGIDDLLASLLKDFPTATREISENGDRLAVRVKLRFQSADQISKLADSTTSGSAPKSFEYLAGQFDVERSLTGVNFTRTISPGRALPNAFIPADEFRDRKLTYILHLPIAASESTANRTANGGRTLTWEQPLASAMRKPIVVHFKAEIIPTWAMGLAIAAVTGTALLVALKIRNRKSPTVTSQAPA